MRARLQQDGGSLLLFSDYDGDFVAALKMTIPPEQRRWDKTRKAWIIDPMYGAAVVKLAKDYLNVDMQLPLVLNSNAPTLRLLKVEYLGRTKERFNGERSAFGWVDGDWNAIFPETVLVTWFDGVPPVPGRPSTLYGVLGIKSQATLDEIKTAYRRLARQWHPDVCREPDAKERFIEIQHAYEILSNDMQRRKYDAGLALEQTLKPDQREASRNGYRAPLRCGWVLCLGQEQLGRFIVAEIRQWEDIVDDQGRVMVSSWPPGAERFVVNWI